MWTYSVVRSQPQAVALPSPRRSSTWMTTSSCFISSCTCVLVEGQDRALVEEEDALEGDGGLRGVDLGAAAAGGDEDAAPVRVVAGDRRLHEGRQGNRVAEVARFRGVDRRR